MRSKSNSRPVRGCVCPSARLAGQTDDLGLLVEAKTVASSVVVVTGSDVLVEVSLEAASSSKPVRELASVLGGLGALTTDAVVWVVA